MQWIGPATSISNYQINLYNFLWSDTGTLIVCMNKMLWAAGLLELGM